ncbi:MAG: ribosomal protein S18-alanine N-acetyltransferase [Clostridiaceae bacterium]|jgi:ribosomal-protein-alanine N-acetyltransferase|nr:ribosomal protein S18-alanine N-acetyltransferase [Clostridiaceae bacterium]
MEITDILRAEYIPQIAAIEKEAFPDTAWSEKMLLDELSNPLAHYFVCVKSDVVLAYGGLHEVADEGQITNVAVKKDKRRCGLASKILDAMLEFAVSAGLFELTLEVKESNFAARALYKNFGFTETGLRKNYYGGIENAVLMTLALKP